MLYFGTVKPGSKLFIPFDTFSALDGRSLPVTNLSAASIYIVRGDIPGFYRVSNDGYTATANQDSVVGVHGITVDLAVATGTGGAGFYRVGQQYWVILRLLVVEYCNINFIAAGFRIGFPGAFYETWINSAAGNQLVLGGTDILNYGLDGNQNTHPVAGSLALISYPDGAAYRDLRYSTQFCRVTGYKPSTRTLYVTGNLVNVSIPQYAGLSLFPCATTTVSTEQDLAGYIQGDIGVGSAFGLTDIDGKSLSAALKIAAAAAAGKCSGAGTGVETFTGLDGSTPRLESTVDGAGNRTGVIYS